jgi:hypothetical protein
MRGRRRLLENRKDRVRRCTGNYFHGTCSPKLPKNSEQIAIPFFSKGSPRFGKKIAVELGKSEPPLIGLAAIAFALKQSAEAIEMPEITTTQQRIAQHGAQGWRDRQSDFETNASPKEALQHLQQWHVALANRLEKPAFFVKEFVLRMPDEWQVCVKNEGERAAHIVIASEVEGSRGVTLRLISTGSLDLRSG